jgi:hypothetical protein
MSKRIVLVAAAVAFGAGLLVSEVRHLPWSVGQTPELLKELWNGPTSANPQITSTPTTKPLKPRLPSGGSD